LIETQVDAADGAEEANEQSVRSDFKGKKVQARLIDDPDYASEEQEDVRFAFLHDREETEELAQPRKDRHKDDAGDEGDEKGEQKGHCPSLLSRGRCAARACRDQAERCEGSREWPRDHFA
jgi:hypothetical protein